MLPGVRTRLTADKPEVAALRGDSLAAQLKRRRIELGLFQCDVARQLGVNQWTLINWERGRATPFVRYYPAIIAFLGQEPWPQPATLGETLLAERRKRGISARFMAAKLDVDESVVLSCEQESGRLSKRSKQRIDRFVKSVWPM